MDKVIYTEINIWGQKAANFWVKRSITSDNEKIMQSSLEHDGYRIGSTESNIYSSGVDADTTPCGAG